MGMMPPTMMVMLSPTKLGDSMYSVATMEDVKRCMVEMVVSTWSVPVEMVGMDICST